MNAPARIRSLQRSGRLARTALVSTMAVFHWGDVTAEQAVEEIVVPYVQGPLPAEALSPPEGTLVMLQFNPNGLSGEPSAVTAAEKSEAVEPDTIVLTLPQDASVPDALARVDEGVIVKLRQGGAQAVPGSAGEIPVRAKAVDEPVIVQLVEGMPLPDHVWDRADESVVNVRLVPQSALREMARTTAQLAATGAAYDRSVTWAEGAIYAGGQWPEDGGTVAVREPVAGDALPAMEVAPVDDRTAAYSTIEVPYSAAGGLPALALDPGADTIVKLRVVERNRGR